MKIVFDSYTSGIGNNGGSKTILRSAETLAQLGHDVYVLARVCMYSWHHPTVEILRECPVNPDAVVAVGAVDVAHSLTINAGKHFGWVRGWETWNMPESDLCSAWSKVRTIANSGWLGRLLDCPVCYSGLDMDKWGEDFSPGSVWVGYLKHHRHETKKSEFARRAIIAAGKHPIALQSNGNLGYDELRKLYNSCSIWISPTESEGFHNVPAEAALCGCHIVCGTTERNGMGDYADDRTADRFSDFDEAVRWLVKPNFEKRNQMRAAVEAIGSREKNMAKFAELLGE